MNTNFVIQRLPKWLDSERWELHYHPSAAVKFSLGLDANIKGKSVTIYGYADSIAKAAKMAFQNRETAKKGI